MFFLERIKEDLFLKRQSSPLERARAKRGFTAFLKIDIIVPVQKNIIYGYITEEQHSVPLYYRAKSANLFKAYSGNPRVTGVGGWAVSRGFPDVSHINEKNLLWA